MLHTLMLMVFHFCGGETNTWLLACQGIREWKRHSLNEFSYREAERQDAKHTALLANISYFHADYTILIPLAFESKYCTGENCKAATTQALESRSAIKISYTTGHKTACFSYYSWGTPATHPTCGAHLNAQKCSSKILDQIGEGITAPQEIKTALTKKNLERVLWVHAHSPKETNWQFIITVLYLKLP